MVTQYGMSEKLGPVTYGHEHENIFMGRELSYSRNYSESSAQRIDEEVLALVNKGMRTAKETLAKRLNKLHSIAQELISKETLEQKDFYALIGS